MRKRFTKMILCMLAAISMMFLPVGEIRAIAASEGCSTYTGSNVEAQNYSRWANPINSYLTYDETRGFMRVQAGAGVDGVSVEYYDEAYNLRKSFNVPEELPLFGGFYETADNYYLMTGQNNPSQSAQVEVYRITKYDKNWNRISSTGLYDCNTTVPFDAGSLRVAEWGKYLFIRTCHEMYQSADGKNHQANVMIQLDIEAMQIVDSRTSVANSGVGYVSHSFNQFIVAEEDGKILALDHGDAYPRSLVLLKYNTNVVNGNLSLGRCSSLDVMTFPGALGENTTGASVGAFISAEDYYLVAGNSVVQDNSNLSRSTRNVFVASVSKAANEVKTNWITNYEEGDGTTSTPQMVKISDREYLLLWTRNGTVYYTKIDNTGSKAGQIYQFTGSLSDCVPIVAGDKLVWYTARSGNVAFYDINLSSLEDVNTTEVLSGHQYINNGVSGGYADLTCSVCGEHTQIKVAESMMIYWNTTGTGTFWSSYDKEQNVGAKLYYLYRTSPTDANGELEILVSDKELISVEETNNGVGCLTFRQAGNASVTIRPKYNPEIGRTFNFVIGGVPEVTPAPTSTPAPTPMPDATPAPTQEPSASPVPTPMPTQQPTPKPQADNWKLENGSYYWYENGVKQGTSGRGQEIYDPVSGAWYWLDAEEGGRRAENKDVYQDSEAGPYADREDGTGKWSRYDSEGHMIKGWDANERGTYYFDLVYGAMVKGRQIIDGVEYFFNEDTGILESCSIGMDSHWETIGGVPYWYENGIRQGYDPADPSYRGKEIYDPVSDAWYWLDNVQQGAKAVSKDVYQESYSAYPDRADGTGKWVRYDENGHMVKGWQTTGDGIYYFEEVTGAMAKGRVTIDGIEYYFDEATGVKR